MLPRFAEHYQQLKTLRRRVRRSLQRQCKRSLAGVALLIALGHTPALAATINVGGTCTLVRAIVAANNDTATPACKKGSGADTIVLSLRSTQTLTAVNNTNYGPTGLSTVRTPITIQGNSSTIRRVKSAPRFHIFSVGKTGRLTLQKATISGGAGPKANFGAGGIDNRGTLNVINSTISGNTGCGLTHNAGTDRTNYGRSTITGSTISGNTDCGVHAYLSSSFVVTNSMIANNGGDGLNTEFFSRPRVANCTILGNGGSGISLFYDKATIVNSTITGNAGTEHPISGAFTGKLGGGVFVDQRSSVSIINSTISGNSANGGGGLSLARDRYTYATVTNSTITGNTATSRGGGIYYAQGYESGLDLNRTILSGNSAPTSREAFIGATHPEVQVSNFNSFGHNGSSGVEGFSPGTTDIVPSRPLSEILDTGLANYGGPTRTHALVAGSPAIDAINDGTCSPPA